MAKTNAAPPAGAKQNAGVEIPDWPFRGGGDIDKKNCGRNGGANAGYDENKGYFLDVRVTPSSSRDEILDVREDRLRIKIAAAPDGGKANAALVAFISKKLAVPKKNVTITAGEKSREKTLFVILRDKMVNKP